MGCTGAAALARARLFDLCVSQGGGLSASYVSADLSVPQRFEPKIRSAGHPISGDECRAKAASGSRRSS